MWNMRPLGLAIRGTRHRAASRDELLRSAGLGRRLWWQPVRGVLRRQGRCLHVMPLPVLFWTIQRRRVVLNIERRREFVVLVHELGCRCCIGGEGRREAAVEQDSCRRKEEQHQRRRAPHLCTVEAARSTALLFTPDSSRGFYRSSSVLLTSEGRYLPAQRTQTSPAARSR